MRHKHEAQAFASSFVHSSCVAQTHLFATAFKQTFCRSRDPRFDTRKPLHDARCKRRRQADQEDC